MRKHLEKMREQHPIVRTRYSVMIAGGITVAIALVWLSTLPVRFSGSVSEGEPTGGTASAIDAFGQAISPQIDSIQAAFSSDSGLEVAPNPGDENSQDLPLDDTL